MSGGTGWHCLQSGAVRYDGVLVVRFYRGTETFYREFNALCRSVGTMLLLHACHYSVFCFLYSIIHSERVEEGK